jgi:hypothetical protein
MADGEFTVLGELTGGRSAIADIPELGGSNDANKSK